MSLVFLFTLIFSSIGWSQDLATTRVLPWSAHFLQTGPNAWPDQDLRSTYGPQGTALYEQIFDLKFKKKMRCGRSTAIIESQIPSINNTTVATRFRYDPVSRKMAMDIFLKEGETFREVLLTSFRVYHGPQNYGRLGGIKLLNIQNRESLDMGWINSPYLSALNRALGGDDQRIEVNSPLSREFQALLADSEKAYVCCFNNGCRQHFDRLQEAPSEPSNESPGEIRRAESGNRSEA